LHQLLINILNNGNLVVDFSDFKFDNIVVPCRRFNDIIIGRGITSIDNLLIDTEGHDYTIIMDIDFNLIKPKRILFENCYIDDDDNNADRPKYRQLLKHLASFGYKILNENDEDTTVILA